VAMFRVFACQGKYRVEKVSQSSELILMSIMMPMMDVSERRECPYDPEINIPTWQQALCFDLLISSLFGIAWKGYIVKLFSSLDASGKFDNRYRAVRTSSDKLSLDVVQQFRSEQAQLQSSLPSV